MQYVGLDVHKNQTSICLLNENGKKVFNRTVRGSWQTVFAELQRIKGPFSVCFEASTGYGYLYENLRPIARSVQVAHPSHLRLIFNCKRKNDKIDAYKLSQLLYMDMVPQVYVPAADVRTWRSTIEHRHRLVNERVRTKNKLRALMRTHGLNAPRNLWTKKGFAWLRQLSFADEMDALQRDLLLELILSLTEMLRRVEKVLGQRAQKHPGVALLMTIPGVGIRTAEAVVAYIDNPRRFHRNNAVGCYFGIVPGEDTTGGSRRMGHITKEGPGTVRKLVVEAAWQGIRRSPRLRSFYERVMKNKPERKKIALVATAHHLLRVMHAMLLSGEVWRPESEDRAA